jgi:hypothetical protein
LYALAPFGNVIARHRISELCIHLMWTPFC